MKFEDKLLPETKKKIKMKKGNFKKMKISLIDDTVYRNIYFSLFPSG